MRDGQQTYQEPDPYSAPKFKRAEKPVETISAEQMIDIADKYFHVDLHDLNAVMKKIGKLELSLDIQDQEKGVQLAKLQEDYLKAKRIHPRFTKRKTTRHGSFSVYSCRITFLSRRSASSFESASKTNTGSADSGMYTR